MYLDVRADAPTLTPIDDEPKKLVRTAFHEAASVVADVGLFREFCRDAKSPAQRVLSDETDKWLHGSYA